MQANIEAPRNESRPSTNRSGEAQLVEVLSDTVRLSHVVYAILISLILSFGGYWIGLRVFPSIVSHTLVNSYSLLLAMIGCILGVVINAKLFKPKRTLSESETNPDDHKLLLEELQIDTEEEARLLENDPATRAELESLNLLHLFSPKAGEKA